MLVPGTSKASLFFPETKSLPRENFVNPAKLWRTMCQSDRGLAHILLSSWMWKEFLWHGPSMPLETCARYLPRLKPDLLVFSHVHIVDFLVSESHQYETEIMACNFTNWKSNVVTLKCVLVFWYIGLQMNLGAPVRPCRWNKNNPNYIIRKKVELKKKKLLEGQTHSWCNKTCNQQPKKEMKIILSCFRHGEPWREFRTKVQKPVLQIQTVKKYIQPIEEVTCDFINK